MEVFKIREVYQFKQCFFVTTNNTTLKEISESVFITAELHVDLVNKSYQIDLNDLLQVDKELIIVGSTNFFGNKISNARVQAEMYEWLGQICYFAENLFKPLLVKSTKKRVDNVKIDIDEDGDELS